MKKLIQLATGLLLLLFILFLPGTARAMTNAISFQGRLTDNGSPANDSYDFVFTLFDAAIGGLPVSDPLTNAAVSVSGGVFTVALDFGSFAFDGNDRWLDLAVRTNGAGTFTPLTPRQAVNPAPYALRASGASYAESAGNAGHANDAISASTAFSANTFTLPLAGDVTGPQSGTVVASLGGQSAATVALGVTAANQATNSNQASRIVRRDASGNFAAGTVTANLLGNVTGNVMGNVSGNATTASTANIFSGSLAGNVTGTQGATVVATVGGQAAAAVASGVIAANAATNVNLAGTLVKRDASGNFSAGTITASDYKYSTAKTNVQHLSASSFVPDGDTQGYQRAINYIYSGGTSLNLNLRAPVQLPHGATVTKLTGVFWDGSPTVDFTSITLSFERAPTGGTYSTLADISGVNTVGLSGGFVEFTDTTIVNNVIDNNSQAYWVRLQATVSSVSAALRFHGVRIEYTVDTLSP